MNPLIRLLLGQQAAAPMAQASDVPETVGNGIDVTASRRTPAPVEEREFLLGNQSYVNEARMAQEDREAYRKEFPRKGMFGVRGTLRDILGVVGDAFLVQGGRNPIYMPRRDNERIADAMAGYTDGPQQARIAAEQVTALGFPEAGLDILKQTESQELRQAQLQSLMDSREDMANNRAATRLKAVSEASARILNNPASYDENGILSDYALQTIQGLASEAKVPLSALNVSPGMTREQGSVMASMGETVNQQNRLPIEKQNADSRRISADASMKRANRPPAGRAAPQPTPSSMLNEFMRIPASKRTKEQQDFIDRMTLPTQSQRSGGTRQLGNPLGGGSRFRPASN